MYGFKGAMQDGTMLPPRSWQPIFFRLFSRISGHARQPFQENDSCTMEKSSLKSCRPESPRIVATSESSRLSGPFWGAVSVARKSSVVKVRRMVRHVLAAGAPGGGYILDAGGPNWSAHLTDELFEKWKAFSTGVTWLTLRPAATPAC